MMKDNRNKNITKIVLITLSIGLVISLLLTSTYALFSSEDYGTNPNSYATGLLMIEAKSKSNNISLTNALPISDADGLASSPYVFTITNTGNLDYQFDVKLLSTSANTFSSQYIKLQIDDGDVITLSSLTNGVIKSDIVLLAGESIDVSIRAWLSIDTPNTEIGNSFESKIVTDGYAIYTTTNKEVSGAMYITNLYNNLEKSQVSNNGISYNYISSMGIMNDRLGGTTVDLNGGNLRYYGVDPGNYIYFNCTDYENQDASNCELWRIIGIFDGKMKIVRNESIGAFAWDTSDSATNSGYGVNDWTKADLMKLLNPGYESNTGLDSSGNTITVNNSLYWNSGVGKCYIGSSNEYIDSESTSDGWCDFTSTGLKNDETRNLIYSAKWNPHGPSEISSYSNVIYVEDASNSDIWVGKVGLLSISDYGYSTDLSLCTSKVSGYSSSNCVSNNWLVPTTTEDGIWTINGIGTNNAYVIKKDGQPSSVRASYGRLISTKQSTGEETITKYYVKPVVYLNESVGVLSGDGSQINPYKIDVG